MLFEIGMAKEEVRGSGTVWTDKGSGLRTNHPNSKDEEIEHRTFNIEVGKTEIGMAAARLYFGSLRCSHANLQTSMFRKVSTFNQDWTSSPKSRLTTRTATGEPSYTTSGGL
jgi:hypothetical protein